MRVVYLNPGGTIGGAEQVLLRLLGQLRKCGADVEAQVILASDGPLADRLRAASVATTVLPAPAAVRVLGDSFSPGRLDRVRQILGLLRATPGLAGFLRRLRRLIRNINPDLIHSNGIKTHLYASAIGMRALPRVWHIHDFYSSRAAVGRALRCLRRRAAGAIAVSQAVAEDARRLLPGLPIAVIGNTIDVDVFTPEAPLTVDLDRLAAVAPAPPETLRIGMVATYARWKGQDVFLEAAARVLREPLPCPVRFYVVGGPIYQTAGSQFSESDLRNQTARLGIADAVGFIPFQDQPAAIYRALDIAVHASTRPEPFGLTIAEAMASGKPVLVAQAGGAAELFTPEHDAIAVPPGDCPALAGALRRLIAEPDTRRRLGGAARRTAVARFGGEDLGTRVVAWYEQVLRKPPNHLPPVAPPSFPGKLSPC